MSVIKIVEVSDSLTFRQRWSHYLVLIFGLVGFVIAINLRDGSLYAATLYVNAQAGISAEYPQNWLIDEAGNYIFRVRDVSHAGFNTTIQVAARPVSSITTTRNVLDALTLERSQTLGYTVLSEETYILPDETTGIAMSYTFVATNPNPFLQGIPIVVEGQDILTIKRGQAIIISFLSDATTFEENLAILARFMNSLEF
jgi:hypothetical protein